MTSATISALVTLSKAVSVRAAHARITAQLALGRVQNLRGEYDAAIAELRTAIDLNSSSALAHHGLAFAFVSTGQFDEAISGCNSAILLSPRDPFVWGFYTLRDQAYFRLGDYEAAMEDARRAMRHPAA
ncbi:MAG: tetratricopeptide repeat protein, partial [Alphaproteobacteria bacterium]